MGFFMRDLKHGFVLSQKSLGFTWSLVLLGVLCFASGCSSTNNLTLQGQITDLQNQRVAIQNERDAWKNRYEELENSNRVQVHAIASSQQQIQTLKAEQIVLQKQLKDSLDQVATAQKQNEFLSQQLAKYEDIRRQQEGGTSFASNNSERAIAESRIPTVPGTVVSQKPNGQICFELPGETLFEESGAISPKGQTLIRQTAQAISAAYPGAKVNITGHLSSFQKVSTGFKDAKEQSMSQAMTVHDVLVRENLLPSQALSVSACGTSEPIISSGTPQGKYRNYRVEFLVTPQ